MEDFLKTLILKIIGRRAPRYFFSAGAAVEVVQCLRALGDLAREALPQSTFGLQHVFPTSHLLSL